MRAILAAAILLAGACGDDPALPTCAEIGCGVAASGSSEEWKPCTDDVCWCSDPASRDPTDLSMECTRIPCSATGDLCPTGAHAEYAEYYDPYPVLGRVCYCAS